MQVSFFPLSTSPSNAIGRTLTVRLQPMHAAGPCVRVPEGVAARAAQARRAGSADRGARVGRGRALDGFRLRLRFDFDLDLGDAVGPSDARDAEQAQAEGEGRGRDPRAAGAGAERRRAADVAAYAASGDPHGEPGRQGGCEARRRAREPGPGRLGARAGDGGVTSVSRCLVGLVRLGRKCSRSAVRCSPSSIIPPLAVLRHRSVLRVACYTCPSQPPRAVRIRSHVSTARRRHTCTSCFPSGAPSIHYVFSRLCTPGAPAYRCPRITIPRCPRC